MNINLMKNKPVGTLATILAGSAAALAAAPAGAAIVSSTTPINLVAGTTAVGGLSGVSISNTTHKELAFPQNSSFLQISATGSGGITNDVLTSGTVIGASSSFRSYVEAAASTTNGSNSWRNTGSGSGLYGVRLNSGAGARYGWMDLAISGGGSGATFNAQVTSWGYEDTGASITAGALPAAPTAAVPEPETLSMMALGLIGLAAARRRQRSTQTRQSH